MIITPNTPQVRAGSVQRLSEQHRVTLSKRGLIFSRAFCIINSLRSGSKINFKNEGKIWKFFIEDSGERDAFTLISVKKGRDSLAIYHSGLMRMIMKSLGINQSGPTTSFKVSKTEERHDGRFLFLIETDVPLSARGVMLKG